MENQPEIVTQALGYAGHAWEVAQGWLMSPAAWSQFALLVLAWLAAVVASRRAAPFITRLLTPAGDTQKPIARARSFLLIFLPLLLPLLAYGFTAIGEQVTRSLFGSGAVIAFGKRVFLFLAARILVQRIITDPFLKLLGRYVLIPIAALYALGILDDAIAWLDATRISMGNISFSVLAIVRGLVAG
ncbi:MAG TPA: mechanosensitive ion channel protein MscS, partial [Aliiroseovarius sp.]|nr:mechanosensitive ion channel protein MscS [Aliiroseovarius sp.]